MSDDFDPFDAPESLGDRLWFYASVMVILGLVIGVVAWHRVRSFWPWS